MTEDDLRQRMAVLMVEVLEVGSAKPKRDVIDEIFETFGMDFGDLEARISWLVPNRAKLQLRAHAASQLAEAAPTAAALLNAAIHCGARFIAMLDEVYARLSRHAAAIAGSSETFRLERAGVDEEHLTISEAFIEQVHRLEQLVRTIKIGLIDEESVSSLVGWDGGELYGRWPIGGPDGFLLADAVLQLAWITPIVTRRASRGAEWARVRPTADAARASAERLVTAAERLIRGHVAHMDALSDTDAEDTAGQLFSATAASALADWHHARKVAEVSHFRNVRALAAPMSSEAVAGTDVTGAVGLRDDLEPATWPANGSWDGTGMSALAGFAAMWRLGLWPAKRRSQLEEQVCADPATLTPWLERVAACCEEASAWLADDVLTTTSQADVTEPLDLIEEFLNLPLWSKRHLLYEVWVLCATLDASEQAGWAADLRGLTHANGVWTLPVGPAADPVATLRLDADPAVTLDVWREPNRATTAGVLTPDVTVSTPAPYPRDLLVVEAKDRQGMSLWHRRPKGGAARSADELKTALGVARRYAAGLRPRATWVCNHCDFRQETDATANHGDVWTRIHVAAQFRPGSVPAAFTESVGAALAPPPDVLPTSAGPEAGPRPGH